jgi:hypothetical protein
MNIDGRLRRLESRCKPLGARPIVVVRHRAGEPVSEAPPGAFVIRIVRPAGAPDLDPETGLLPRRQTNGDRVADECSGADGVLR